MEAEAEASERLTNEYSTRYGFSPAQSAPPSALERLLGNRSREKKNSSKQVNDFEFLMRIYYFTLNCELTFHGWKANSNQSLCSLLSFESFVQQESFSLQLQIAN